jgi:geranylgeranyl pyrophosphate synthase
LTYQPTQLLTPTFFELVKDEILLVEEKMSQQAVEQYEDIKSVLSLLVASGGKRVRPTVSILVGKALGADVNRIITLAAAIELLHTATLVHDDLIDNSLLRRGLPTLNSRWSPGATVLTGDFIFARAAKLAADVESIPVMQMFAQTLATIVGGEIRQLFTGRWLADRECYFKRIYAKTASLFETSAATAGMIAPGKPEIVSALAKFGYDIGMAFQIMDDILDFTGEQVSLGKPVGNDLAQVIIYVNNYPETDFSKLILRGQPLDGHEQAQKMVEVIRKTDCIELAHDEARQSIQRALLNLDHFPSGVEKDALMDLANYIITRKK